MQEFVTGLVDATRTSYELEVILNHNPDGELWQVESINITDIAIIIMIIQLGGDLKLQPRWGTDMI